MLIHMCTIETVSTELIWALTPVLQVTEGTWSFMRHWRVILIFRVSNNNTFLNQYCWNIIEAVSLGKYMSGHTVSNVMLHSRTKTHVFSSGSELVKNIKAYHQNIALCYMYLLDIPQKRIHWIREQITFSFHCIFFLPCYIVFTTLSE